MLRTLYAATAAALIAGAALAVEPALGAKLGATAPEIGGALAESGYDMVKYERENGLIEVVAVKEQTRVEIYVDSATGEVVKREERARRGQGPFGVSDEEIRAMLTSEGYEISKYARQRGEIEVYATKDGRRWEIDVDPHSGEIVKVEEED